MESNTKPSITIETIIKADVSTVWKIWSSPEHIVKWNAASDNWHTTKAENDLKVGGHFSNRMEAKDGSFSFDFGGVYTEVIENEKISYSLEDARTVDIHFTNLGDSTKIVEIFEAETTNSLEMQKAGWQAILDNFKRYTETLSIEQ